MVATDTQAVAIAGYHPHHELGIGHFDTRCHSGCAPVDGMESVGIDVVRKTAAAANAAYPSHVFRSHADLGQCPLYGRQDGVVAATWAPAHILVGGEVLSGEASGRNEVLHDDSNI